jgi:hypothetical protein
MLRAQTAASALAAGLSVLSNFVAVALNPRDNHGADERASARASAVAEVEEEEAETPVPAEVEAEPETESEWTEGPSEAAIEAAVLDRVPIDEPVMPAAAVAHEVAVAEAPAFDLASLPPEMQDLHRRANRVAKVAMQDIKLLRPKDVKLAREHKDICHRLRSDLDKARKEYDRRFRSILDHPTDYFHHWLVEILAEGDTEALGEYPYPSPVLRH